MFCRRADYYPALAIQATSRVNHVASVYCHTRRHFCPRHTEPNGRENWRLLQLTTSWASARGPALRNGHKSCQGRAPAGATKDLLSMT